MCFSARAWADYRDYVRKFGAKVDFAEFARLYGDRARRAGIKTTRAMDAAFADPADDLQRRIKALIDEHDQAQAAKLERELFKQTRRLADAERTLSTKTTKKAQEDQRIATNKIAWAKGKLADLRRTRVETRDARIFPGVYAPVMVMEGGQRVVRPMRYQCRPAGKPASYDRRYPGTYNARRDNLEGFWKGQFGHDHGIMVVTAFYENVSRHAVEGRELAPGEAEENVVLEFAPEPKQDMLVACLWSRWSGKGEPDLLSFAAITDEPPAEVAAAGHDRCIIPIKQEHVDAWLDPDPKNLDALYALLDDRARPYYEHRMAA
ncbi:SOS response-associated peptidase family protein [Luteimonas vadosa]|uniref:SOS response-associated peptidase n=1 Tax=Luteimonas vadosa TaxID=1165507 RepID=A0ABP9E7Y2_9GAMM